MAGCRLAARGRAAQRQTPNYFKISVIITDDLNNLSFGYN